MSDLNKTIGLWQGTGMMLSIVLGAGLLTLPGLAAQSAGSGALAVWLVCAVVSVPLLAVFAIVGRLHPDAGGIAAVMKKAFGAFGYAPSTLLFLGAVAVGLPSIALVGGKYAASAFDISPHLAAAVLIVAATIVNLLSSRAANRMNAALAVSVIVVLLVLAVFGWLSTNPSWHHVAGTEMPEITVFGATFMMVFFAFTGWEVAANLAGEFRKPKRDVPLAMALSFVIAVVLYLVLAVIVVAAGPEAATEAPFSAILSIGYGEDAALLIAIVAILLIFANLVAAIWAVSRMVCSAASEGLITRYVAPTTNGVPIRAVLATAAVLLCVVALASSGAVLLGDLLATAGMNFLLLYTGAAAALAKLSKNVSHRLLSGGSILIALVLIVGRGIEHLLYPAAFVGLGILAAAMMARGSPKTRCMLTSRET